MTQTDARPNILLIMPDQMRGDCLSLARHPAVLTPNIDWIGGQGTFFRRAYTTCPSCIPARRSLLTGKFPASNGMVGFIGGCETTGRVLPQLLSDAGYQTALIGRNMHQHPAEKDYGYQTRTHGSSYVNDDDLAAAIEQGAPGAGGLAAAGMSYNGWTARPFHLDERLHPTTWVARKTREYLASYDARRPLFLTSSFYAPHPPLVPPAFYMERYLRMPLPPASVGDWAPMPPNDGLGAGIDSHYVNLTGEALRSAQAGYFGLINHIDDQIYWLMQDFMWKSHAGGRPWVIVFTSDHGEMLGDHHMFRKCEPYEGSAAIPMLICGSSKLALARGGVCDQPVCLEDLMPTLLELAGLECPAGVDGRSLVDVLRGRSDARVRDVLHGEHSPCYSGPQAFQMLTDGRYKYIWRPGDGSEQLFDLQNDPGELTDLSRRDGSEVVVWRQRMIERLKMRPEGFVKDGQLVAGRPYEGLLPHARG
ncbi:MAG: sulfatase-like hydrolase/transferase [Planctomycetaceae bacterium]|nr:sulfatase-like hydrolase/transferase [Planctomycetaceae bacterium]